MDLTSLSPVLMKMPCQCVLANSQSAIHRRRSRKYEFSMQISIWKFLFIFFFLAMLCYALRKKTGIVCAPYNNELYREKERWRRWQQKHRHNTHKKNVVSGESFWVRHFFFMLLIRAICRISGRAYRHKSHSKVVCASHACLPMSKLTRIIAFRMIFCFSFSILFFLVASCFFFFFGQAI